MNIVGTFLVVTILLIIAFIPLRIIYLSCRTKRKRRFLDGIAPSSVEYKPEDVIYREGVKRPPEEEIVKELKKQQFKYQRIEIYMAGTIVLVAIAKVLGVNLPYWILLPCGAALGVLIYFLSEYLRKMGNK